MRAMTGRIVWAAGLVSLWVSGCGAAKQHAVWEPPDELFHYDPPVRSWESKSSEPAASALDGNGDGTIDGHEALSYFPHEALRISARGLGSSGQPGALVLDTQKGQRYELTVDQVNYRSPEPSDDRGTPRVESALGVRLRARLEAHRDGIDLTNLTEIAGAADRGSLAGTLWLEPLGLAGRAVDALLPAPTPLGDQAIREAMLAAASIRALLEAGDPSVEVRTDLLSTRPLPRRARAISRP
jgi:hypothetical protein